VAVGAAVAASVGATLGAALGLGDVPPWLMTRAPTMIAAATITAPMIMALRPPLVPPVEPATGDVGGGGAAAPTGSTGVGIAVVGSAAAVAASIGVSGAVTGAVSGAISGGASGGRSGVGGPAPGSSLMSLLHGRSGAGDLRPRRL
jgi:hypothetical protein